MKVRSETGAEAWESEHLITENRVHAITGEENGVEVVRVVGIVEAMGAGPAPLLAQVDGPAFLEWIHASPAQIIILGTQVHWSSQVESSLKAGDTAAVRVPEETHSRQTHSRRVSPPPRRRYIIYPR